MKKKINRDLIGHIAGGVMLVLTFTATAEGDIRTELDQYFAPSILKGEFYTADQIVLDGVTYTRGRLEPQAGQDLTLAVRRLALPHYALEEVPLLVEYLLEKKSAQLRRPLTEEEKREIESGVKNETYTADPAERHEDEAEAFALIPKSVEAIFERFIDLDNYDEYPMPEKKRYFKQSEEISPAHLQKNHPRQAERLIAELTELGIFPIPEGTYYQYSNLEMDKPALFNTVRYEVQRTQEPVTRGQGAEKIVVNNLPTVRSAWKIEDRLKDHDDFGTYGAWINSGYVEFQPYVNAEGVVFDGPGGFSGPEEPITSVTYHVYTAFHPEDSGADATRFSIDERVKTLKFFLKNIANFLRQ
ncbi:MAG: hypothetical protein HY391_05870 [Deltaproteobacteria bacterium]|nr:hypothetical protein [Deltaproteobacteria bacterium]